MQKLFLLPIILTFASCSYEALVADYLIPETIIIEEKKNFISIRPQCYDMDEALVLYPGGLVEPEAYIPLSAEMSKQLGLAVFIQKMPFNLAVFGRNRVEKILEDYSYISRWYMAGHSLGGIMASSWLYDNPGNFEAMIFLSSYPLEKSSLESSSIEVLSLRGTEDALVTPEDIEKSRRLLPPKAVIREIQGGNHAQFGKYGEQKDDGSASIADYEQRKITIQYIEEFLNGF